MGPAAPFFAAIPPRTQTCPRWSEWPPIETRIGCMFGQAGSSCLLRLAPGRREYRGTDGLRGFRVENRHIGLGCEVPTGLVHVRGSDDCDLAIDCHELGMAGAIAGDISFRCGIGFRTCGILKIADVQAALVLHPFGDILNGHIVRAAPEESLDALIVEPF